MFDETKKSVESILSQRLSSPFYGTLIISWLIWNWKIIYLTIFVSESKINGSKIDYIVSNYNDINHIVWLPLASTVILLVALPIITNGAYWLDLIYNRWRVNRKNTVEGKQLLSIEQSINLREQIVNMEKRFETLLGDKDTEIAQLKGIIDKDSTMHLPFIPDNDDSQDLEITALVDKIKKSKKLKEAFTVIETYIVGKHSGFIRDSGISPEVIAFYISNDIIESTPQDRYIWTNKGKKIYKIITNETFKL